MADLVEQAKKKAAFAAVDEYVRDNMVCGVAEPQTMTLFQTRGTKFLQILCWVLPLLCLIANSAEYVPRCVFSIF